MGENNMRRHEPSSAFGYAPGQAYTERPYLWFLNHSAWTVKRSEPWISITCQLTQTWKSRKPASCIIPVIMCKERYSASAKVLVINGSCLEGLSTRRFFCTKLTMLKQKQKKQNKSITKKQKKKSRVVGLLSLRLELLWLWLWKFKRGCRYLNI